MERVNIGRAVITRAGTARVRTALQGVARIVCEQDGSVSTKKMAETEHRVAVWFTRLASRGPPAPKALALAQHILDGGNTSSPCAEALLHLDQTQQAAVISALSNPVSIITGRAGTGKSSVLAVIEMLVDATAPLISDGSVIDTETKALQRVHEHAAAHHLTLAAPTGKAANRLTQLTGKRDRSSHSTRRGHGNRTSAVRWGAADSGDCRCRCGDKWACGGRGREVVLRRSLCQGAWGTTVHGRRLRGAQKTHRLSRIPDRAHPFPHLGLPVGCVCD